MSDSTNDHDNHTNDDFNESEPEHYELNPTPYRRERGIYEDAFWFGPEPSELLEQEAYRNGVK
jgi:hypothetical protein